MTENQREVCSPLLKREFSVKPILDFLIGHTYRFWSWGSTKYSNVSDKGLFFKVNGNHHKGYVLITLDWSDTFDVHIINTKNRVIDTFTGVYIDQLFDVIDERIEKIPTYTH
jgi:hypothetical protein